MMINSIIFAIGFIITSSVIVFLDKRNNRISRNIVNIKAKILAEADSGDEFAKLFDISAFYKGKEMVLQPNYLFLDKFNYSKKLVIGVSEEKFWKNYKIEKENFIKDPNYRIYRLFINNVRGGEGELTEEGNIIKLTIKKDFFNYNNVFANCTNLTNVTFPKIGYNKKVCNNLSLCCQSFEKIRTIWHNSIENDIGVSFIIGFDEVEDFCNICELVCGEELSW